MFGCMFWCMFGCMIGYVRWCWQRCVRVFLPLFDNSDSILTGAPPTHNLLQSRCRYAVGLFRCQLQPLCFAGQRSSGASTTTIQICRACEEGTYQEAISHRQTCVPEGHLTRQTTSPVCVLLVASCCFCVLLVASCYSCVACCLLLVVVVLWFFVCVFLLMVCCWWWCLVMFGLLDGPAHSYIWWSGIYPTLLPRFFNFTFTA
jgi:hypothetical protein